MATLKSIKNKYLTVSDGTVLGVTTNTENISALSFKLATADSLSKFNLVDGFTDDYNDDTGVDAGDSSDATRNASNYYSGASTSSSTTGFTVTGSQQTFTVPAGVSSLEIKCFAPSATSNNGGFSKGNLVTSASTQYTVVVGEVKAAIGSAWNDYSYGGGGRAYSYKSGGGLSGVFTGTADPSFTSTSDQARIIIAAGGGGGRGHQGSSTAGQGGGAEGTDGKNSSGTPYGIRGTQSSAGAGGGGGAAGSVMRGGESSGGAEEAGGGGGYYGGGGGGSAAGSGGGSGYVGTQNDLTDGLTYVGPSSEKTSDSDYPGSNVAKVVFNYDVVSENDMTLQSNAFTAQADPTTARIILDEESVNSDTTLNTDLKAYVSRDNGTTFTQITNIARQSFMAGTGIDNNTKLMLHCNGTNNGTTFTDSTFSPKTVTVVGDTHTDTAIKKFGTASAQFDGTGDYLTCATSDDWNFGSSPFTMDLWVYHTGTPTDHMGILCHRTGGNGWELKINAPATNKWTFYDSNGAAEIVSNSTVTDNAWVHLAVTRNSAGLINLWVDGTKQTSERTTATFTDYSNILRIGDENQAGADNKWLGYMDEIRIVKGVCLYTTNFTPATKAYSSKRLISGSVDISGQPAGSNMKYKITTHNQAATKETRIYGTSMAWA